MPKKIPMRQCLGCREMKPKRELIRVVRSPQGEISLDFHGKKPGRGAYLCPNQDCLKRARKSKALERAFSLPIPDDVYASLEAQMEGLALRAGRLAVGEEPVGAACRGHKAYLLLLASDAADNTIRRASHFSQSAKNTICLQLPLTKAELGSGLGRTACAMAALTDVGFAAAVAQRLAQSDPAAYGPAWQALSQKASQAKKRRDQKHSPHKDKGKRK